MTIRKGRLIIKISEYCAVYIYYNTKKVYLLNNRSVAIVDSAKNNSNGAKLLEV